MKRNDVEDYPNLYFYDGALVDAVGDLQTHAYWLWIGFRWISYGDCSSNGPD